MPEREFEVEEAGAGSLMVEFHFFNYGKANKLAL